MSKILSYPNVEAKW